MSLKTTFILLVLVAAGGAAAWYFHAVAPSASAESQTLTVLENELKPDKLTRIDVQHDTTQVTLERKPQQEWTLPGQWPVRQQAVEHLVGILTNLRTRFVPIPLGEPPDLKSYGLDGQPLTVTVQAGGKDYTLVFGEEPGEYNRFSRPTFLRLDSNREVVRLAPGLVSEIDLAQEYYMKHQLFPAKRLAKEGGNKPDQLDASALAAKGPDSTYTLVKKEEWEIEAPFRDRPDPDAVQKILVAIPDIWAEQFVVQKDKKLEDFGLKEPAESLQVTLPSGRKITLQIGKESKVNKREVTEPAPPFGPPRPPMKKTIEEPYRYAKIADNDQIFEIKADKLKEIFVAAMSLRDPRLVRFRTDDARRLEIKHDGRDIILAKEKDKDQWRVQKPKEVDAEASKITELLDKLSGLEARDKDVIEKGAPKEYGLDKAAVLKVTVEESKGTGAAKTTKTHEYTFKMGKHDTAQKKVYVQVAGWPRINAVDDALLKLVERPALAYRSRKVLDASTFDLAKIELRRPGDDFTLEQVKNTWRLASPVHADVDTSKADDLARDLARLEAVEFVTAEAKPEDLDKLYGLAKPSLSAKLIFTDAKKPSQTVLIGKQRDTKQEYFARLESDPAVFVVKKDLRDAVDKESLAYRPLKLWDIPPDDIAELRVRKGEPEYDLKRQGDKWQISGPFEAPAMAAKIDAMTKELTELKCLRYVVHHAKDLGTYGLEKPYLRLALVPAAKKESEEPKKDAKDKKKAEKKEAKETKERILLIGKPAEKDKSERYARLGDSEAVFVLGDKTVAALDQSALDFLDPTLFKADASEIQRVRKVAPAGAWTLQKEKDQWRVVEAPAAPFPAGKEEAARYIEVLSNLRAKRYAAYGLKADPAAYGLDKAGVIITFTVRPPTEKDKKSKPAEHTLLLGKEVKDAPGERYARLDQGPAIAILDAATVKELEQTYLDFVNRQLFKLDAAKVTAIQWQLGTETIDIAKRGDAWRLLKPDLAADSTVVLNLVEELAFLRGQRIVAYQAKDLKPYGLDQPVASATVQLAGDDKKTISQTLRIGGQAKENGKPAKGDRYVQVSGSAVVAVLPEKLLNELLGSAERPNSQRLVLYLRDHNLARFDGADRIVLERSPRKAVFAKMDETWKMIDPVQVDADSAELTAFVKELSRLRADELVAERSADLKLYGLDRPRLRWQVSAAGKGALDLLIGVYEKAAPPQKPRCFARLANSDMVFLLSADLTAKALGEYRHRAVWSSLDAAQVEKLTYNVAGNTFVLEKMDNKWQLAGKPGLAVKEDLVRDILDTLGKLKAERYVLDKGADLKLFGLQPPAIILEAQLPTDKRTLHIGRLEGDSRRYYANLPGSDAVFVIAEKDAQVLVHTGAQSLTAPTKK
jgi:hypothetical protein